MSAARLVKATKSRTSSGRRLRRGGEMAVGESMGNLGAVFLKRSTFNAQLSTFKRLAQVRVLPARFSFCHRFTRFARSVHPIGGIGLRGGQVQSKTSYGSRRNQKKPRDMNRRTRDFHRQKAR